MKVCALLLQLLLLLHLCSSNVAVADGAAAQHVACQLVLQGRSSASSSSSSGPSKTATNSRAVLNCTSDGPALFRVPVGIISNATGLDNASSLGLAALRGVEDIDEECKQQAAGLLYTPLLFFCGNYSITFVDSWVHDVGSSSANATAVSSFALLAFGGHVKASISNGSFVGNAVGAVVLLLGNASLVVDDSAFSSNTLNGSCISADGASSLVVENSTFTNNTATPPVALVAPDGGAALRIAGSATALCNACTISGNKATEGWGGGVRASGGGRLAMRGCLLLNTSAAQGGSLWAGEDSRVSLRIYLTVS
jgi:hypothetical protein